VTGEVETTKTNTQELANLMVGRKVALTTEFAPGKPRAEVAMEVIELKLAGASSSSRHKLSNVSASVKRGESLV